MSNADPTAEPTASDRSDLEAKLSRMMNGATWSEVEDEAAPADEIPDADDTAEEVENDAVEEVVEPEQDASDDDGAAADAPTLPDAHRRSLIAFGWSPEEIDSAVEVGGDRFLTTAARLHTERNTEVANYAAAGRRALAEETETPQSADAGAFDIDWKGLADESGLSESVLKETFGPMMGAAETLKANMAALEQAREAQEAQRIADLAAGIDEFFTSEGPKEFADKYGGAGWDGLTPEQEAHRNQVMEMATQIMAGATVKGKDVGLEDALYMAHGAVSAEWATEKARAEVREQVTKRSKQVSQRPVSKTTTVSGDDLTAAERLSRMSDRLKQHFHS